MSCLLRWAAARESARAPGCLAACSTWKGRWQAGQGGAPQREDYDQVSGEGSANAAAPSFDTHE